MVSVYIITYLNHSGAGFFIILGQERKVNIIVEFVPVN